ncbi:phosphoesterase RecJ-like protein [Xylanibacillus composti]|uniref:Phosphoesterase RecJ-like protein n=1 Tax=Xylanibacillus composti TaxID=1572762 RepID=A0A8J4H0E1_9BACL|nr:bifunctional oligoribonuclease/PAP phosphatase NrnA [Xylanibacillus composti]GIQ68597.1 phosphoesterase RecJ-like protein [Xylanibacillus composti]
MSGAAAYVAELEAAKRFMREHDRFLVLSHVSPDGDAISSTCAIGWMLKQLGKSYVLANADPVPGKFAYLKGADEIRRLADLSAEAPFACVIAVDCADYSRLGDVSHLLAENCAMLNIDHHPTNDRFGTHAWIVPHAAATAEILFDLLESLELKWEQSVAESLYTGLLTDTGGFRYSNTSAKVLRQAAHLLELGCSADELAAHLLEKVTLSQLDLLRKALSTLSFRRNGKIAWIAVSIQDLVDTGASPEDLDGLVNYPRNIEGVEVGILFKQVETDRYKVSFRSGGSADVAKVAQQFGGGGHIRASGATVAGNLEEVAERVLAAAEEALT